MKRDYMQPATIVVKVVSEGLLLEGSVTSVSTNLGDDAIIYGGGSNQAARVKSNTVDWDDWE